MPINQKTDLFHSDAPVDILMDNKPITQPNKLDFIYRVSRSTFIIYPVWHCIDIIKFILIFIDLFLVFIHIRVFNSIFYQKSYKGFAKSFRSICVSLKLNVINKSIFRYKIFVVRIFYLVGIVCPPLKVSLSSNAKNGMSHYHSIE